MSDQDLEVSIAAIAMLDLEGLRAMWARRYGVPPRLRSVTILRQLLAWRLQTETLGGLDAELRRALTARGRLQAEGLDLGIGARMTRNWQGRRVEVEVTVDGFCWDGRTYRSLSAAATAIAGSRWNGPRFFGLRDRVSRA